MLRTSRGFWLGALIAGIALSCAAGDSKSSSSGPSSSSAGGAGATGGGGQSSSSSDTGGGVASVAVGVGGSDLVAEVFGHGPDVLYRLDPKTKAVTVVGPFNGCSSVLDIAIDKDGNIFGTSFAGLHTIDADTAQCQLIASGQFPNSLSFVPSGTLDANKEALVGYNDKDYVRIDTATGALTVINAGALSGNYVSSGDIVSVIDGGTYLTIKEVPQNTNGCNDCIVEVDPATGVVVTNYGSVGFSKVFGLAYWAGRAYGFSQGGDLFEIEFTGNTVATTLIDIPSAPANLQFWGAGSTTSAPIIPN